MKEGEGLIGVSETPSSAKPKGGVPTVESVLLRGGMMVAPPAQLVGKVIHLVVTNEGETQEAWTTIRSVVFSAGGKHCSVPFLYVTIDLAGILGKQVVGLRYIQTADEREHWNLALRSTYASDRETLLRPEVCKLVE